MTNDIRPVRFEKSTVLRYELRYETPPYSGRTGLVTLLLHAADFVQRLDDPHRVSEVVITPVERGYDWTLTLYLEPPSDGNDG
jgi:hypothetical protein